MSQPSRNKRNLLEHDPRRVVLALLALALIFAGSVFRQAYAQQKNTRGAKPEQKDEYHRPEPSHTITPQIPGTSRNKPDKVFLENADSMVKTAGEVDRQVVIGNVKFRQMGMWMYCDSAYYFPELNSMDAFGNVRMEQGDTLFVYSDKLFYDGTARFARLRCGPTEPSVRLINRNVKLTTDSLDYDLAQEMGWYAHGGRLEDEANVLTSIYGQYSPATKDAEFFHDVELHGTQNDFNLYTDTLYYNTDTHIARIETPTKILTSEDEILTSNGYYNTLSGIAELLTRSTVVHTDSLNRATFLEGDSIVYDPTTRISRAYSFRNPAKHPSPVVITDTARKATLIGGFAIYNDSTREAMATEYPLMMEYSRADTLFLRADTIRTWVLDRPKPGAIADSTAIAESLADKIEEGLMEENPLEENQEQENPMEETPIVETQIGESPIEESPIEETPIERETLIEETPIEEPQIEEVLIDEPLIEEVAVVDTSGEPAKAAEPQDSTWHMAKAYPRARFFRTDMQGVADTIVYTEIDSILKLIRKPIAWNEERQVRGDTIIVHLQDSTADWARIPSRAMLMEHVEEDYYNQLHSDKMMMFFENGGLRHLDAEGSVQAIILPMEEDSTYNRLVDAESSYMTIDMKEGNKLDRLKMWPEVTGNVTPLFMVKQSQKLLPKAEWLDAIRPRREWYGGRLRWADDLGELPEELELYFEEEN